MVVYIEYALLFNAALDSLLMYLALKMSRVKVCFLRVLLSGVLGAVFAVLYPLLSLPAWLKQTLKWSVALCMCLIAFGKVTNKKQGGRYAFTVLSFLLCTFLFGGVLTGVWEGEGGYTPAFVTLGVLALGVAVSILIEKLWQKKKLNDFLLDCTLVNGEKRLEAVGYVDSGNFLRRGGVPVCFVSPSCMYELFGEDILLGNAPAEEICVTTVTGERVCRLYLGELQLSNGKKSSASKRVYFALSAHIVNKEYSLLLPWDILQEG